MAIGIEVYDASGNVIVTYDTLLPRFIGYVDTGAVNGSVSSSGFSTGTAIWFANQYPPVVFYPYTRYPVFSFAGTTLSWDYSSVDPAYRENHRVYYGVY